MITSRVVAEATAWHQKYNKPVLMSEYGADTMPGLHLVRILETGLFYQNKILKYLLNFSTQNLYGQKSIK